MVDEHTISNRMNVQVDKVTLGGTIHGLDIEFGIFFMKWLHRDIRFIIFKVKYAVHKR